MVQGYRAHSRLHTEPRCLGGTHRLGLLQRASSQAWRALQHTRRPSVPVADGRSVQPTSAKQGPSVQQQQQQQQQHDSWLQSCKQVTAFQRQHGRLPRANVEAQGSLLPGKGPLGLCCTEQQRRKAGSKGPPLSAEERAALLAIPGWSWWATKRVAKPWEQRRQEVEAFHRQHGRLPRATARITSPLLPVEKELGTWAERQRQRYKGNTQPPLSTQHIAALIATPGWSWGDYPPWEQRRQEVGAFYQQHNRMPRAGQSSPFLPGEEALGNWVNSQRRQCKAHQLSAERVAALEAIPGWCWEEWSQEAWEVRLRQVGAFYLQHGRLPRTTAGQGRPFLPGEQALGKWTDRQRSRFRGQAQPSLSAQQIAALERTPGWTWAEHKPWEVSCKQLQDFVRQHGRLPRRTAGSSSPFLPGEQELGRWMIFQRQLHKVQKLSTGQMAASEATPGWCWEEWSQTAWELRLQQVQAFVRQHGRIPRQQGTKSMPLQPSERVLGTWCATQRRRRKGSTHQPPLTAEQQAALAAVPGWYWAVEDDRWEQQRQKLEAFVRVHGRLPRIHSTKKASLLEGERELASWRSHQRRRERGTSGLAPLSASQQAALKGTEGTLLW